MLKNLSGIVSGFSLLAMAVAPAVADSLSGRIGVLYGQSLPYDSANVSASVVDDFGGAINSLGVVSIGPNNSNFSNNSAIQGGAIYLKWNGVPNDPGSGLSNAGVLQLMGLPSSSAWMNATFSGNKAIGNIDTGGFGGAIYLDRYAELDISNSVQVLFNRNESAVAGGAIYNQGIVNIYNARTVKFSKNNNENITGALRTATMGGAIFNLGVMHILGDTNEFSENMTYFSGDDEYGGGAIQNRDYGAGSGATLVIGKEDLSSQNIFNANVSAAQGGAIYAAALDGTNNNSMVTINGETSFMGNSAVTQGGAISNYVVSTGLANLSLNGDTSFIGNSAGTESVDGDGGAIYNNGTVSLNGTGTFTGNSATGAGGAVYNAGTFVIDGDATFSENTAAGVANDIYNVGTLRIASGTTTVDGGIGGTGILQIDSGAVLDIGTTTLTQGTVQIDGRLVAMLANPGAHAEFNVANFTGDGTLALTLRELGIYDLYTGDGMVAEENLAFSDTGLTMSSPFYNVVWINDGKSLEATRKTPYEIAESNELSVAAGQTIFNLMDSSSTQLNDLALAVQQELALGNSADVENIIAGINPETESVLRSVSAGIQNTVANMAAGRMSMVGTGRAGGDVSVTGGGLWAQAIYNKSKQNNAFNGYTRGVAFGLDGTVNNVWTLGVGYAYAHSGISATARDTKVDSLSIFAYGQYKPDDWYINMIMNYTMSDYVESGTGVQADYDVDSFGTQIMAGYDFDGGITPQFGFRYVHVSADDYKNSLDIANSMSDLNYLTAVLETKYSGPQFNVSKKWSLYPELRYGVLFDMIADNQVIYVVIPGVETGGYTLTGDRLSRLGAEFGLGMGAKYRGIDLSLNYDIEVREGYTSQTGLAKFRYNF